MPVRKDAVAAAALTSSSNNSSSDINNHDNEKRNLSTPSTTALENDRATSRTNPKPFPTDVKIESSSPPDGAGDSEVDEDPGPGAFAHLDIKAIHRKMDLRIIPVLTILYLLSFLDRGNIGESSTSSSPRLPSVVFFFLPWSSLTSFTRNILRIPPSPLLLVSLPYTSQATPTSKVSAPTSNSPVPSTTGA
jgi:hypothetical protein